MPEIEIGIFYQEEEKRKIFLKHLIKTAIIAQSASVVFKIPISRLYLISTQMAGLIVNFTAVQS